MDRLSGPLIPHRWLRWLFLLVLLGVVLNAVFVIVGSKHEALSALAAMELRFVLLAALLAVAPWFTNAVRTLVWTRFLGGRLGFRDALHIVLAMELGSALTPTLAGGGYVKLGMLMRRGLSPGTAAFVTAFSTLEDLLFFALVMPLGVVFTASRGSPVLDNLLGELARRSLFVLGGAVILGLLITLAVQAGLRGRRRSGSGTADGSSRFQKWKARAKEEWGRMRWAMGQVLRQGKSRFALTILLTAIQWGCRYSVVSALAAGLGLPVEPVTYGLLQWVVFTAGTLVPTPGGVAAVEAAFALVYAGLVPSQFLPVLTAVWRFFTFYGLVVLDALILGLGLVGRKGEETREWKPPDPQGSRAES